MVTEAELDEISQCFKDADSWDGDQLNQCKKLGFDAGLSYIGEGANRVVMGEGDRAYKFTKFAPDEHGGLSVYGNRQEVEFFYDDATPEVRAHLAAPHDWADDYSWVEFYRYPTEEGDHMHPGPAVGLFEDNGFYCDDMNQWNVTETEKGFVVTDYESCEKAKKHGEAISIA